MRSAEDILNQHTEGDKGLFDNRVFVDFEKAILAMEEYANQFRKSDCEHPYASLIGEESGDPTCLSCGKKLNR